MALLPIPFANPYTYAGHSGVDFPQARGAAFKASGPGVVTSIDYAPRPGNTVWVQYDNGPLVGYAHMDRRTTDVIVRSRVQEGTILGRVGSLGTASTGPHLHVEVNGFATTAGFWRFFDRNRVVGQGSGSGGGSLPFPEDDMSAKAEEQISAIYAAIYGPANIGASSLSWSKTDGSTGSAVYGLLDIDINTQTIAAKNGVAIGTVSSQVSNLKPITDAQIKAIADAVAAQIGVPTVDIDYDKIATDVRARFQSQPLTGTLG